MHNFGTNLIRLRKSRGLSQYELADSLNVSRPHIYLLEAGKRSPSWEVANRVAEFFGVTLNDLAYKTKQEREYA